MDDEGLFNFRPRIRIVNIPMNAEEIEGRVLARLDDPNANLQRVRLDIVRFYRSTFRPAEAMYYAEMYLAETTDVEEKAEMYFVLGQTMEHVQDYESAFRFYTMALECEPKNKFHWYFIHNNIGFSLNQLERYSDAEQYMREAIRIEPNRSNAFKNLGLSLEGQGRVGEAARSFIAAVRADASDPRAFWHLKELAETNPSAYGEVPDLNSQIEKCRQAVEYAVNENGKRN